MIAMQYSFELPADYDMGIIERRVRDKGHVFDDMPGMGVKAFLYARRGDPLTRGNVNLYAPFYVWTDPSAMVGFLCSDKFAGVTNSFGWPSVQPWSVLAVKAKGELGHAKFATRSIEPIHPFEPLALLSELELANAEVALRDGALLTVSGFDPKTWQRLRFCLWREPVAITTPRTTSYAVLHISTPQGSQAFWKPTTTLSRPQ